MGHIVIDGDGMATAIKLPDIKMILQMGAHCGQVVNEFNAVLLQQRAVTYTR